MADKPIVTSTKSIAGRPLGFKGAVERSIDQQLQEQERYYDVQSTLAQQRYQP